jgi:hypothetical protein
VNVNTRQIATLLIVLCAAPIALAQSMVDERRITETALDHFLPLCVGDWKFVVSNQTEPLILRSLRDPSIDGARADYTTRNRQPVDLIIDLPANGSVADISSFSGKPFDWPSFEAQYGMGTWVVRVSRPGFIDASNAIVRIDLSLATHHDVSSNTVAVLSRSNDGQWKFVTAYSSVYTEIPPRH